MFPKLSAKLPTKHLIFRLAILLLLLVQQSTMTAQQTVGLFVYDDLQAYQGYTLFNSSAFNNTYLLDMCGRAVKTWEFENSPRISVYLTEDAKLIRTERQTSTAGLGSAGAVRIYDWDGNLEWEHIFDDPAFDNHHDIEPLPNGNILVLGEERVPLSQALAAGLNPVDMGPDSTYKVTAVLEVRPQGASDMDTVWQWYLSDHLIQDFDPTKLFYGDVAAHPEKYDLNYWLWDNAIEGDWNHSNSIDYHEDRDLIVISMRHQHEIIVIDHSTSTSEAAGSTGGYHGKGGDILYRWGNPAAYQRGDSSDQQLFGQHDAYWIPEGYPDEGKIMIFNNGRLRDEPKISSIEIIVEPLGPDQRYIIDDSAAILPLAADWTYQAPVPTDFWSGVQGGAQRLPNGNTLICEAAKGHFFEITPSGDIVWDYVNPETIGGPVTQGTIPPSNTVFKVQRYAPDYPAFDGKDLSWGLPIEFEPFDPSDINATCPMLTGISDMNELDLLIGPVPFTEELHLHNPDPVSRTVRIMDELGRIVWSWSMNPGSYHSIRTNRWKSGFYVMEVEGIDGYRKLFKQ